MACSSVSIGLLCLCVAAEAVSVVTQFGELRGNELEHTVEYIGVPFAEPPIGNLRFADPVSWTRKFGPTGYDASVYKPRCPQSYQPRRGQESCLFLNIWAPASKSATPRTVLLFVHGGSFLIGAGDMYNGSALSTKQDVVTVSINYRLGVLGFAQVVPGAANFALKDQREAMRWVKNNIASFGGDPENVMLYGESAGAISVALHLCMPKSRGLFKRALMESGEPYAISQAAAVETGKVFVDRVGCHSNSSEASVLVCLREVPLAKLVEVQAQMVPCLECNPWFADYSFPASVDGVEITQDPAKQALASALPDATVPLLAGFNNNEGNLFVYPFPEFSPMNSSTYTTFQRAMLKFRGLSPVQVDATLPALAQLYPCGSASNTQSANCRSVAALMLADCSFRCGTYRLLRALSGSKGGNKEYSDTWKYRFDQRTVNDSAPPEWGVYHSSELVYVFGTQESGSTTTIYQLTPTERRLSRMMQAAWSNFAATGDPNGGNNSNGSWMRYSNGSPGEGAVLQDTAPGEPFPSGGDDRYRFCTFWDAVQANATGQGI
jgi:carboxylesterase type B